LSVNRGEVMPFSFRAWNPDTRAFIDKSDYSPPMEQEYRVRCVATDVSYIHEFRVEANRDLGLNFVRIAPVSDDDYVDLFFRSDSLQFMSNLTKESFIALSSLRDEVPPLLAEDGCDVVYLLACNSYYQFSDSQRIVPYSLAVTLEACAYVSLLCGDDPLCVTDGHVSGHEQRLPAFSDDGFRASQVANSEALFMNLSSVKSLLVRDAARSIVADHGELIRFQLPV